jgi:hypothetical protein
LINESHYGTGATNDLKNMKTNELMRMNSKTSGSGSVLNKAASRAYLLMNNNENDTKDGGSSGPMTST